MEKFPPDFADLLSGRLLATFRLSIEHSEKRWRLHLLDRETGTEMTATGASVAETWDLLADCSESRCATEDVQLTQHR